MKTLIKIYAANTRSAAIFAGLLVLLTSCSEQNSVVGDPLSAEWQIDAFSSAAPDFIGDDATIVGYDNSVIRQGNNGWTCLSANPRNMPEAGWSTPHEAMPLCADEVSMAWVQAYVGGETPNLSRDAYIWMAHGDMGEDNTQPFVFNEEDATQGNWIESGPHIMLMPQNPSSLDSFPSDFNNGEPYAMWQGNQYAHLMIPIEGYFDDY